MDIGCLEVIVHRKSSVLFRFLQVLLIMLCVVFILIGMVAWPALIIGAACGVGAWFVSKEVDVDYEYSYVDRELRVAKVMRKESRKNMGTYELDKMEICGPVKSVHLDNYHHKTELKTIDYSSRTEQDPDPRFEIYFAEYKLLIEPDEELKKVLKQTFPSKVFLD